MKFLDDFKRKWMREFVEETQDVLRSTTGVSLSPLTAALYKTIEPLVDVDMSDWKTPIKQVPIVGEDPPHYFLFQGTEEHMLMGRLPNLGYRVFTPDMNQKWIAFDFDKPVEFHKIDGKVVGDMHDDISDSILINTISGEIKLATNIGGKWRCQDTNQNFITAYKVDEVQDHVKKVDKEVVDKKIKQLESIVEAYEKQANDVAKKTLDEIKRQFEEKAENLMKKVQQESNIRSSEIHTISEDDITKEAFNTFGPTVASRLADAGIIKIGNKINRYQVLLKHGIGSPAFKGEDYANLYDMVKHNAFTTTAPTNVVKRIFRNALQSRILSKNNHHSQEFKLGMLVAVRYGMFGHINTAGMLKNLAFNYCGSKSVFDEWYNHAQETLKELESAKH